MQNSADHPFRYSVHPRGVGSALQSGFVCGVLLLSCGWVYILLNEQACMSILICAYEYYLGVVIHKNTHIHTSIKILRRDK